MQKVQLGRTGLAVSIAALGAGGKSRLGQSQGASRESSVALVRSALDQGVTLLDTAAIYGTEAIVGEAIRGRRNDVVISTKAFITVDGASTVLISAADFTQRVDEALKRLGTDRIDIMQLHGVTEAQYDHAVTEILPAMKRLIESGKVRFTGLTERFAEDSKHKMLQRAATDGLFDVLMVGFNFVNQTAARTVLPAAKKNDLGTLCMYAVRGPLAQHETANALVRKLIGTGEVDADAVDPANPLGFLLEPGVAASLNEAAYRFCRHSPGIDVVITGTGSVAHLAQNLQSISAPPLPAKTRERLAEIFARVVNETAET